MLLLTSLIRRSPPSLRNYARSHSNKPAGAALPISKTKQLQKQQQQQQQQRDEPKPSTLRSFISYMIIGLQSALIYHFINNNVITASPTHGPSMLPTLYVQGDWVLILKWYRRGRGIKVGDLVEYSHPMVPGVKAIKRVVGMPGDFIVREDFGELAGIKLDDDGAIKKTPREARMIQIPQGHCWVMGDNRAESRDSRLFGPLPLALVKGKVVAKVLPLRNMQLLENNVEQVAA